MNTILILLLSYIIQGSFFPVEEVKVNLKYERSKKLVCPIGDTQFAQWFQENRFGVETEVHYEEGRFDFPDLKSFTVKKLTKADDQTVFKCKVIADGALGSFDKIQYDVKKTFKLVIQEDKNTNSKNEKPNWEDIPSAFNKVSSTQSHAIFQCRAIGANTKITSYRLKEDGSIMKKLKGISSVKGVVLISPKGKDSGNYKCVAENSAGRIEHKFSIDVEQDGNWSEWADWTKCNVECGRGMKFRKRECNNPTPSGGGRFCEGQSLQRQQCQEQRCRAPALKRFGFEITDDELLLHCGAKGIPSPKTQWKLDGLPLEELNKNETLAIPISKAAGGLYSCTVKSYLWIFSISMEIKQSQINA